MPAGRGPWRRRYQPAARSTTERLFIPAPQHEQIAQRNVHVVQAARRAQMLSITVAALVRQSRKVELQLEQGGELPARLLATLGLEKWQPAKEAAISAGLSREPHCNADEQREQRLVLEVPRGQAVAVYLSLRADKLPPYQYALLRLLERQDGKVMGGNTYLIVGSEDGRGEQAS